MTAIQHLFPVTALWNFSPVIKDIELISNGENKKKKRMVNYTRKTLIIRGKISLSNSLKTEFFHTPGDESSRNRALSRSQLIEKTNDSNIISRLLSSLFTRMNDCTRRGIRNDGCGNKK